MKNACFKAFTLIELLIVVAIIAILAAIAVPNFLEAQTRAKVSRVKSDLRSIATAIESYFVDNNHYPCDQDDVPTGERGWDDEQGFFLLTSPVAYMSGVTWNDPFSRTGFIANNSDIAPIYQMASGEDPERRDDTVDEDPISAYAIYSLGPDQTEQFSNDDWPFREDLDVYDPTNGTVSIGEIVRFGGQYRTGGWSIGGTSWEEWNPPVMYP